MVEGRNRIDLVLPDGQKVHYVNTSSNYTSWTAANFVATLTTDPLYYGSVMTWNFSNNNGWLLKLKNGTVYSFLANANTPGTSAILSITDRYGNTLSITRDGTGNITQITSPNGRWLQFTHDSNNRITQAYDDLGRTVNYTYDTCASGYLCSVRDANGGTRSYSYYTSTNPPPTGYGGLGNLSKIVDQNGNSEITNLYDTNGRAVKQTLADGTSNFQIAYTLNAGLVSQTTIPDPNGNVEQKTFDSNGFVTTDINAKGTSISQTSSFTRDPNTELISAMTNPLGRQFSYTYDSFQLNNYQGQAMSLTHANLQGVTCSNCLSSSIGVGATYDPIFNQLTSITDALSHTWAIGYDSRGNPTSVTDPLSHQITLSYNIQGQLTSVTDALNNTASFGYSYGDLAAITDPLNNTIHRNNDGAGRMVSQIDALGNVTQYAWDPLNRLTQIADPNNGLTRFTYDAVGNLKSVTDAKSNQTSYGYDSRNRLMSRTDALTKVDSYGYDASGNRTSHTDRNGNIINYTYDPLNRVSLAQYNIPSGSHHTALQSTIAYTWDAGDRITKAVDSLAGTINRTYDGLNDLTQEATPQGTINYTYDNAGRRNTMQVAGQAQATYTYDNANRLTAISQGSAVGFSYDNASRRTCLALSNGVIASYGYDNDSRVTSLTYGTGGSCASPPSNLGNLTYAYDADGRRTVTTGSLAAVTLPANVAGGTSTAYNADNAQTKFNGGSLSYDTNGNLTGDGTNTYTWDARNHLTQIAQGRTTIATFVYDGFGRRMNKTINGTTTQFLYDRLNPVQELNSSNGVVANLLTGLNIDEYFTRTASGITSTFLPDALGSTIGLVTANNGPIATNYTYQPFGATTVGGSTNGNPYQFTGRENDATGLYFYRARYYSPTFQRFIAQDPIDFAGGSANLYEYALEAPTFWVDPLGLYVTIIVNNGATVLNFAGHMTISVNGETPVGLEDQGSSWNIPATVGMTVPGNLLPSNDTPSSSITIPTTPEQDNAISRAIEQDQNNPPDYNLLRNNCTREADKLLQAGGLSTPGDLTPNGELNDLSNMYGVPIKHY